MTYKVHCDGHGCENVIDGKYPYGWVEVKPPSGTEVFAGVRGEFCSLGCVVSWANRIIMAQRESV